MIHRKGVPHRVGRRAVAALGLASFAALGLFGCDDASNLLGTEADATVDAGPVQPVRDAFVAPDVPDMTALGEFGAPCEDGRDCLSGYCVEGPIGGKVCTQTCTDICPGGFECAFITNGGADRTFVCLADKPELCKPCETDLDCDDNADLCLKIGNGMYCGEDCATDGHCPDGYECIDALDDAGAVRGRQCAPTGGAPCLPCTDADGDKYGEGGDCLGFDCNDNDPTVYEGAEELCDGKDNDCNSESDERRALGAPPADVTCLNQGVCAATEVTCSNGAWGCAYPAGYEAGTETRCDGLDNDCDGRPDDDIDLTSDPANCSFCGNACRFDHAEGICEAANCELGPCEVGFFNADGNDGNGCEYGCNQTQGGVEVCDEIDNNCDGLVDEGFDTMRDPLHCGRCGFACVVDHALPGCDAGVCVIENCEPGYVDLDQDPRNGCELPCTPSNDGVEICDTVDNNCDGRVDENFDLSSDLEHCGDCNTACAYDNGTAICDRGQCELDRCDVGHWNLNDDAADGCEYTCGITFNGAEACDLTDNDCDGLIDEDFDTQTDVLNCGACLRVCQVQNAQAACVAGSCALAQCNEGFWDLDRNQINGCEYICNLTNGGVESCDLTDNDCDGLIDEDFDLLTNVDNCGACGAGCALNNAAGRCTGGECAVRECLGGFQDLDGLAENGCEYGCLPSNGGVELCDGIDNNCDGNADEDFDTQSDLAHCGGCNRACVFPNGVPLCDAGQCMMVGCAAGFVDLNRDPSDGCEYECTVQAGPDEPDPQGADSNCDGYDGDLNRAIFVSAADGNDGNDGLLPGRPVRSIGRAFTLALAFSGIRTQVIVTAGNYAGVGLALVSGAGYYGGYSGDFRRRTAEHSVVTAEGGVMASDLRAATVLDQVDLVAPDAVGAGASSTALYVLNSGANLALRAVSVTAGNGVAGLPGLGGSVGNAGSQGANGAGNGGGGGGGTGGGRGGTGVSRGAGPGGAAGAANGSGCGGGAGAGSGGGGLGCNDGDPRRGGDGGNGCGGNAGGHGGAGNATGAFGPRGYDFVPSNGAPGNNGGTGGGGGGGGAGGGEDCQACVFGACTCVYCGTGRGGGGGGGGGDGGTAGTGGSGGGASIGIIVINSDLQIRGEVVVNTRSGGRGGAGGNGGAGGAGAAGGFGATDADNTQGDGGNGGRGGNGGNGGCGGGGGGGPSVGIWGNGGAAVSGVGGIAFNLGAAGAGGASCGNGGAAGARENIRSAVQR
jgi:hypothetical protein